MRFSLDFNPTTLEGLIGGASAVDAPHLGLQDLKQAHQFIDAYGYDVNNPDDLNKIWSYHRRAVAFIDDELLFEGEHIPELLSDPHQLKDVSYLLIYASTQDYRDNSMQQWACAILKVMHVLAHLDNDLFTVYSSSIQDQVLRSLQSHISTDPASGTRLGGPSAVDEIHLKRFDIKPFKTSNSSIIKLLAKPEAVAFNLLDKLGVRFVTKHLFDVFRVMRFLVEENIVSLPNVIPDQSNNTLYPLNLFWEVMESVTQDMELTPAQLDQKLQEQLAEAGERAEFQQKPNSFSSGNYHFIKFITRRLVRVQSKGRDDGRPLTFFYPYEVQIMNYDTYLQNLSGPSSHEEYKKRQLRRARARVLGFINREQDHA